jgi:hypothetical protein
MNDQLSIQRLAVVLRNDLIRVSRSALLISGTAGLVALVVSLIGAYDGDVGQGATFYRAFFIATLFAWGTIATSVCFNDLHGRGTNTAFLLLPASALEKTLSRVLLYTVGLVAYLLLFTMFLSWVLEGIDTVWIGDRRELFSPLDGVGWSLVPRTFSSRRRCSSSARPGSARFSSSRRSRASSASGWGFASSR